MRRLLSLGIAVIFVTSAQFVQAEQVVAIVEAIDGPADGIERLDYLEPHKVIVLRPDQTMVVGYLKSCLREAITGGRVVIGAEFSVVEGGGAERMKLPCGAGKSGPGQRATAKPGMVFRDARNGSRGQQTVYGTSPIIDLGGPGSVLIVRTDRPGDRHRFDVRPEDLLRGRFFDLGTAGAVLHPGGTYRFSFGPRRVDVVVDSAAQPGAALVSRLVSMRGAD